MPPTRRFTVRQTIILWNADAWLPDNYKEEPHLVCRSLSSSLCKAHLYNPRLKVYGDEDLFSEELMDAYVMYDGFYGFKTMKGNPNERVLLMLVSLCLMASNDKYNQSRLVIVTKLAQDWDMIFRVASSLRSRGSRVLFAMPKLDVDEARTRFGITVCSNLERVRERIPLWVCPHLFDQEQEQEPDPRHQVETNRFLEPHPYCLGKTCQQLGLRKSREERRILILMTKFLAMVED